jgi:glycosyltransferase involved in cell wall biosynthesis
MSTVSGGRGALLAGFTLPGAEFQAVSARSPILLTQTQNFADNLNSALHHAGFEVSLISFPPVTNFPEYPQIVFRTREFEADGSRGLLLGFVNLLVLKHVTRSFALRTRGLREARRSRPSVVVVHGVHLPLLRFALLLKKKLGVTAVVVLTDPPGVVRDGEGRIKQWLRRVDAGRIQRELRRFDRALTVTQQLANDFAPGVTSLTFPGFAPTLPHQVARGESSGFVVAYAGGLSEEYGVGDLVRAVQSLPDANVRLEVFGSGALAPWIVEQVALDTRISFHGAVDRSALLARIAEADLLVNPRRLDFGGLRYSFPSKLLEYMGLGVPTLSTPMPTIPPEVAGHLFLAAGDGVEALREQVARVMNINRSDRIEFGAKAREFIVAEVSAEALGRRLSSFL